MVDFDKWAARWLGQPVCFMLFGEERTGFIIEALDTVCAPRFLVAELADGNKAVKVGAPYQAFRRISNKPLDTPAKAATA